MTIRTFIIILPIDVVDMQQLHDNFTTDDRRLFLLSNAIKQKIKIYIKTKKYDININNLIYIYINSIFFFFYIQNCNYSNGS